jgi:hypothetical protein
MKMLRPTRLQKVAGCSIEPLEDEKNEPDMLIVPNLPNKAQQKLAHLRLPVY